MQLNAHGGSCEDNIAQSIGYCCIFDGWLECLNLNSCQHLQFSLDQTWQWHHHYVFFDAENHLSWDNIWVLTEVLWVLTTSKWKQKPIRYHSKSCDVVISVLATLFAFCFVSVYTNIFQFRYVWWEAEGRRWSHDDGPEVSLILLWGRVTLRSVMFQVDMEDRIKW